MSSEGPRTVVPGGITDPVEAARAELKAALAAIEEKANVPKRWAVATERRMSRARAFAHERPVTATLAVVAIAATVGATVWGLVRAYVR
ncbi:hypothetical protein ABCS02_13680 [Microbacterium sp. X-17]|uniref:hypothetical protein n=1 Tax=Microbacterium sp. X-17 TaxID=3144404 RepID=UPI0031F5B61D